MKRASAFLLVSLAGTLVLLLPAGAAGLAGSLETEEEVPMMSGALKKLAPVLVVDKIEPCLNFWVERLGFEKSAEVPEGDELGFVILAREKIEVMLQTRVSLAKDIPALARNPYHTLLYLEVADFDDIAKRLQGTEVVVPERRTFYGAREIGVREPCGNIVLFAAYEQKQ